MESFPRLFLPAALILPAALALVCYWVANGSDATARIIIPLHVILFLADMGGHLSNNSFTVWTKNHIIDVVEMNHVRSTAIPGEPPGRAYRSRTGFMNSHIVMKIPLISGYVTFKLPEFNEFLVSSRFAEVLTSPHRFWLTPGTEQLSDRSSVLRSLGETGSSDPVPVYVEGQPRLASPYRAVPGAYGMVRIGYYSPEEIRLEADVPGPAGGFLSSTERYAPGWKVWVDGAEQPVVQHNLFFRGVYLAPGQHSVLWRYRPDWWWLLVFLSYATLLIAVGVALWLYRRERCIELVSGE
jgi:hypothetical protein